MAASSSKQLPSEAAPPLDAALLSGPSADPHDGSGDTASREAFAAAAQKLQGFFERLGELARSQRNKQRPASQAQAASDDGGATTKRRVRFSVHDLSDAMPVTIRPR